MDRTSLPATAGREGWPPNGRPQGTREQDPAYRPTRPHPCSGVWGCWTAVARPPDDGLIGGPTVDEWRRSRHRDRAGAGPRPARRAPRPPRWWGPPGRADRRTAASRSPPGRLRRRRGRRTPVANPRRSLGHHSATIATFTGSMLPVPIPMITRQIARPGRVRVNAVAIEARQVTTTVPIQVQTRRGPRPTTSPATPTRIAPTNVPTNDSETRSPPWVASSAVSALRTGAAPPRCRTTSRRRPAAARARIPRGTGAGRDPGRRGRRTADTRRPALRRSAPGTGGCCR